MRSLATIIEAITGYRNVEVKCIQTEGVVYTRTTGWSETEQTEFISKGQIELWCERIRGVIEIALNKIN